MLLHVTFCQSSPSPALPAMKIHYIAQFRWYRGGGDTNYVIYIIYICYDAVKDRIDFKLLLITFKALHGLAPMYITELLKPYRPPSLRSNLRNFLTVPSSNTSVYGDRAFSFAAAKLWNALLDHIRCMDSITSFKSGLKTFLFKR